MEISALASLVLAVARSVFVDRRNDEVVGYIDDIIAAKEANHNIDSHLATVAEMLRTDQIPDIPDLRNRINTEVEELLARGSEPE